MCKYIHIHWLSMVDVYCISIDEAHPIRWTDTGELPVRGPQEGSTVFDAYTKQALRPCSAYAVSSMAGTANSQLHGKVMGKYVKLEITGGLVRWEKNSIF